MKIINLVISLESKTSDRFHGKDWERNIYTATAIIDHKKIELKYSGNRNVAGESYDPDKKSRVVRGLLNCQTLDTYTEEDKKLFDDSNIKKVLSEHEVEVDIYDQKFSIHDARKLWPERTEVIKLKEKDNNGHILTVFKVNKDTIEVDSFDIFEYGAYKFHKEKRIIIIICPNS